MTMITPSYLGETIEYSSLHACRSTLEDPTREGHPSGRAALGGERPRVSCPEDERSVIPGTGPEVCSRHLPAPEVSHLGAHAIEVGDFRGEPDKELDRGLQAGEGAFDLVDAD